LRRCRVACARAASRWQRRRRRGRPRSWSWSASRCRRARAGAPRYWETGLRPHRLWSRCCEVWVSCDHPKKSFDFSGTPVSVLVLMENNDASLQMLTLARKFGQPLRSVPMDAVQPFAPDAIAAILARALAADELDASSVFAAGTDRGNDVIARLAARTGLPFAANCIAAEPGDPVGVVRQRWGGSLFENALLRGPRALITVAPHTVRVTEGPTPIDVDLKPYLAQIDAEAPIMQNSDYAVIGDLKEIVPAISAEIRKTK